jgi:integrase/recombinase XerD
MLVCQFRHVPACVYVFVFESGRIIPQGTKELTPSGVRVRFPPPLDHHKMTNRYMIRQNAEALKTWIEGFLRDCRVRELSPFTVEYYRAQLANFQAYCSAHDVIEVTEITADILRGYLLHLEAQGANPGGRHAKYRAVRVFLLWWQRETEPEDYTNPITKVKPPKVARELIDAVPVADIQAMIKTCGDNFTGTRDKAIILCLLDTGARARELLNLNIYDVDLIRGDALIRMGKGRKPRIVFIGKKSRRALRAYLKIRQDESPAVWVTSAGDRMAITTLQGMLSRRGKLAAVMPPSPHDFRRAHALMMLRAGVDVITLSRLMGHTTLEVLKLYLAQSADDLHAAHDKAGVVDRIF